nr:PhoH family protein [Longirhabdus pacifica]
MFPITKLQIQEGVNLTNTKIVILDTNVLLHDPNAIYAFQNNEVIIPAIVLEEVDSKKRNVDEIGRNARYVARLLDQLRKKGKIHDGVLLDNGGMLKVELNHRSFSKLQTTFSEMTNDNRILAVALNYHHEQSEKNNPKPVTLVSKDTLVRIKADVLGITAEDYMNDHITERSQFFSGYTTLTVHPSVIDEYYSFRSLKVNQLNLDIIQLYPNEFVILKDEGGSSKSALLKVNSNGDMLEPLYLSNDPVWGISARNAQQRMALELLLDNTIPLVTLTGRAGTGKTLLTLAAGLMRVEDDRLYKKLLIGRPVVPVGKDIGYLPGEKEEKLRPWMQPVYDNLEYLFNTKKPGDIDKILAGLGSIQVEALTYIRGRSIPEQFIIIDEAQNLSRHEVKTIVSRVGEGSKIVLMGDPEQIDHPYLDAESNGLTYVIECFKQEKVSGHVTLKRGERSHLAQLATDLL